MANSYDLRFEWAPREAVTQLLEIANPQDEFFLISPKYRRSSQNSLNRPGA
jgi:hypothetical protein